MISFFTTGSMVVFSASCIFEAMLWNVSTEMGLANGEAE